ncbi:MAG: amidohydrolase family protein [Peptostreptococcaceae bacterium]|nr:amidohydrolase family protein [Peptostreptococcaceae bacterium]
MFRENEIVSIEVGKYADFIVIDMDIFNIDPIDIEKTNVLMTFFDGRIVYESKN